MAPKSVNLSDYSLLFMCFADAAKKPPLGPLHLVSSTDNSRPNPSIKRHMDPAALRGFFLSPASIFQPPTSGELHGSGGTDRYSPLIIRYGCRATYLSALYEPEAFICSLRATHVSSLGLICLWRDAPLLLSHTSLWRAANNLGSLKTNKQQQPSTKLTKHFLHSLELYSCCRLTLPMLRLLSSEVQGCADFWKSSKPSHVGIHWKALSEYSQMRTHLPRFQSFFSFFASFCICQIGRQQHEG